ncbi:MAG: hypothetical protein ACOYWZ_04460 [Bacillota bacterium]
MENVYVKTKNPKICRDLYGRQYKIYKDTLGNEFAIIGYQPEGIDDDDDIDIENLELPEGGTSAYEPVNSNEI